MRVVVVEDAVRVTTEKGVASDNHYILGDNDLWLVSRPGGIEGVEGAPAHSTMTIFLHVGEDGKKSVKNWDGSYFGIEQYNDPENRLIRNHVTFDIDPVITATRSAFRIRNAFSA
jgi:hypothetical protein